MSAETQENAVRMTRARKSGSRYKSMSDDYIHYKEDSDGKIAFEYSYSSNLYNQLYMVFPSYVYVNSAPKTGECKRKCSR